MPRPEWQLPDGVPRGVWEYAQADHIAEDYDHYFADNWLFEMDEAVLRRHIRPPGVVVDFGCGTGRALLPLIAEGLTGVGVDLSMPMLRVVREKAELDRLPVHCLQANLVELDGLRDNVADYGLCLFSTLGMIRPRAQRDRFLRHARRIIRPGGRFVLHVHNVWYNLTDAAGRAWLLRHAVETLLGRGAIQWGDKFYPYRGIPRMYLHTFRRGELLGDLRRAGFRPLEVIPLARCRNRPLPHAWWLGGLRANGWIVACE
jgi:SAM-dependent methyltransferase